jgi:membrane-associated phospholipid phosphatase
MKRAASLISYLMHPLLMPTLGLYVMLHSGSYLSLLDPAAKRAILFVMALGTLVFPLMMLPVFFYRNLMQNQEGKPVHEEWAPRIVILILYIITTFYFLRLPLNHFIHGYILSVTITLGLLALLNIRLKISLHTASLGGLAGLVIALIMVYEIPMEGFLLLVLLAAGAVGTSRLVLGEHRPYEVYTGFLAGFACVLITLLVY